LPISIECSRQTTTFSSAARGESIEYAGVPCIFTPAGSVTIRRLARAQRGSITVESAIVLSAVLVFVLGMVEFGALGFMQITVDAGAFLNAHQNAIGVNDALGPADATHQVFPQIATSSIANNVLTAPSPTVPVDYGYNDPSPSVVASSSVNRHGGASIMEPYLSQTTISQSVFRLFNESFNVQSQASEPNWLQSAPLWDAANVNYGTAYSASNSEINSSVFENGDNSPLYYMSLNKINHCATPGSWGNPSGSRGVCPTQDILTLSAGEYLDYYNWSNGTAGIGGYSTSTGPGGTTGTFEAAACHQRMLSTLVYFFQYLSGNNFGNSAAFAADPLNWLETTYNPYYYNRSGYTNFSTVSFFSQRPNGASSDGIDTLATNAIKEIYGWDVETYNGPGLGVNPLYPTRGCT